MNSSDLSITPGEVGLIDLLARHQSQKRWIVIELKRNQTSDATVGQVLRYMGWVRKNLASVDETVEGLIVCRQNNKKLQHAISGLPNVRCMTHQVSFKLVDAITV